MAKAKIIQQYIDIEDIRRVKIDELNASCESAIIGGFQSSIVLSNTGKSHYYSLDRDDQRNFMGKLILVMNDSTNSIIYWKTQDVGDYVEHTKDEFIAVCKEAQEYMESRIFICVQKKKAALAAETIEQIKAIVW